MFLPAADPRLNYWCPQPVDRELPDVRLDRFPRAAVEALASQIGPLANLRSSAGCAVVLTTDSPRVTLHLSRLRHHQVVPQGIALEVAQADGTWTTCDSADLREQEADVAVELATGLLPGEIRPVWIWLPLISTAAVNGVTVHDDTTVAATPLPEPRWLAIGDSLTQGFSVQSPRQNWVHRVMRRSGLPCWNLGVGGIRIEPAVFAWALRSRTWDLVTIGLGSNHAWNASNVVTVTERAAELLAIVRLGGPDGPHRRVLWQLPPWKPCEDGKGPPDFSGVPLDRDTGERVRQVRAALRDYLGSQPDVTVVDDLMPKDARWYPDGLHPFALGFSRYADGMMQALGQSPH
jgi:lysophospholipase L1-like esterase